MLLAFRFRLYPNEKQKERMANTVEVCRHLWNKALADRKEAWEYARLSTTYEQQCLMLTVEAKTDQQLGNLHSQVGQDVLNRLNKAFKAFFEHRARYPKFKKRRECGSFTYPQAYNGPVKPDVLKKRLFLSKIGNVRTVFHRPLPTGLLRTCTVKREADGKWYACLVYDIDDAASLQDARIPESWRSRIGVDRGLISLIATSDGEKIDAPRFLRKAERRLKHLQKNLSSKEKGSKNREKARQKLARQCSKVANQRSDFNHKLSNHLVKKHNFIALEDLQVKNLVKNHLLAKSISDAGWGQFARFVEYKLKRARKIFVKVEAPYTTQECYFCGTLNQTSLDIRQIECGGCHRILDRDKNASQIVLKRAIARVGQDRTPSVSRSGGESHSQAVPELKPVETGPLLPPTTERAGSVEEAGTRRGGNHTAQSEARRWKPTNSFEGGCHHLRVSPSNRPWPRWNWSTCLESSSASFSIASQ